MLNYGIRACELLSRGRCLASALPSSLEHQHVPQEVLPVVKRNAKAHLRPFNQLSRHVPIGDLARNPFGHSVSYLERVGQPL